MKDSFTLEEIEAALSRCWDLPEGSIAFGALRSELVRPRHQFHEGEVVCDELGRFFKIKSPPHDDGTYEDADAMRPLRLSEMPLPIENAVRLFLSITDGEMITASRAAAFRKAREDLAAFDEVVK